MEIQKDKNRNRTFLTKCMKLLIICLVLVILIFVLNTSCSLDSVIIEGSSHYTEDELKEKIITQKTDKNAILLYLRYKYGKWETIPFVEDISVKLVNKNTVAIQVYEKNVIGCIEYMGTYMYFDKDGIIVESSNEKLDEVPFVTGLKFSSFVLYSKLEVQQAELFGVILKLTQLIHKFQLDINTIGFGADNSVTLLSGDNQILLGNRDTYDEQIAELKNLLPKAEGKSWSIDLSTFEEGQDIIATPRK